MTPRPVGEAAPRYWVSEDARDLFVRSVTHRGTPTIVHLRRRAGSPDWDGASAFEAATGIVAGRSRYETTGQGGGVLPVLARFVPGPVRSWWGRPVVVRCCCGI